MMPVKKLNRLPGIFGDIFYDQFPDFYSKRTATPQVNVIETDKKFKIEIAAPGMSKDDLKIELKPDNQLVVSLEKDFDKRDEKECKECETEGEKHYLRREFVFTSFRQIFNLPDSVDKERIAAKMKHGVLCINLPKRDGMDKPAEAKQIAIE